MSPLGRPANKATLSRCRADDGGRPFFAQALPPSVAKGIPDLQPPYPFDCPVALSPAPPACLLNPLPSSVPSKKVPHPSGRPTAALVIDWGLHLGMKGIDDTLCPTGPPR
mmetsp:Transcript_58506/g.96031  ORF Transcript_58506/g.96031 Transcript_58506/m.96031 type:complete len:110 (+) Transcript_58506:79-408(+)